MNAQQQTLVILRRARRLIEREECWTQHTYARDADGLPCNPASRRAVKYSLDGAVRSFIVHDWWTRACVLDTIAIELEDYAALRAPGGASVATYNDLPDTTHADVLAVLRLAIERQASLVEISQRFTHHPHTGA